MIASKRDSLCMQILRAKYKVKHDWLRSDPPKSASPIWRAIENAKKIIVKGACYLIGDGTSIDVWQDPWVPWVHTFIPKPRDESSPQPPLKVSQLINSDCHCWKAHLVHEIFDPPSAQAILSISIPSRPTADKLCWILDPKGKFSVKSACQVSNSQDGTQTVSSINWKKLWSLKAPERIKMFLWRLGVNALPTRENLSKRMEINDTSCLLCKNVVETPCHLFLHCPIARALWFSVCWGFKPEEISASSTEDILNLVLNPPSPFSPAMEQWKISLTLALTLEEIWRLRNTELHSNAPIILLDSIKMVQRRFLEITNVYTNSDPSSLCQQAIHWTLPPLGWIKVNVDAAFSNSRSALAVVARDYNGNICNIWARTSTQPSSLQAEAEALLWATQIAKRERWRQVIFESDSKICIDALTSTNAVSHWSIQATINNCLSVTESIPECSFVWIRRSCNSAAHEAARLALISKFSFVFNKDNLPPALAAICKEDVH
ncbi:hypothetical protein SO802_014267 [Lithocarpus litseifolius]|uniref:Reverse transcriptase zinc-binding domain-containing protein n=1 Tax=Lithocarpus litseifolius TaxID=425828 RepID=A0AAW2CVN2_9ROSI